MSKQVAVGVYQCLNDCRQGECPGHEMKVTNSSTSDTITVEVDGEIRLVMDDNAWVCMLTLANSPEWSGETS